MSFALLFLAAALALPDPAPKPPDDPAVAVCEMMVKQGLRSPASFVRIAEPSVGDGTVTLRFSFRDAHGGTARDERTCRFRLSPRDGRYHVEAFRRDHLAGRMAAARAKLRTVKPGNDMMLVRSEILDIGREMFVEDDRMKKAERQAALAGIYPIAPGATRLGEPRL